MDAGHVGGTTDPPTLTIVGESFNFTNFVGDYFVNNNVTTVIATSHPDGWYELQYAYPPRCGLAKINGADIELTKPLLTCATEWPTDIDPAFTGTAVAGSQSFCDLWILGVFGALIGTFLSTLGLGLQKMTHEKLKAEGKEIENYCNHPLWLLGIGCLVVDAVLDVWTFGLAPASLLAPMASMVLVWNVVTSPCLVGEQLTKRGLVGTVIIISGSICATIFSQHDTPSYSLEDFGERWSSPEVIIYEICVVVIFFSSKYGLHRLSANEKARQLVDDADYAADYASADKNKDIELAPSANATTSDINVSFPSSTTSNDDPNDDSDNLEILAAAASSNSPTTDSLALGYTEGSRPYLIAQFVMAMVSGMLGGQSIIFAKTVVELLKATFFGPQGAFVYNAFASPPFYLFLVCLICVLMTQTQVLNMAMHNFDSLNVIPIFITFYQVFGVIGGAIYYKEFDDFGVTQAFMFPIGCSISFCGIYVLSKAPEENEEASMEELVDEDSGSAPSTPKVTTNGTRGTPALTSGGSVLTPRERYRSSMASAAAGTMFGFLNSSAVIDRDGVIEASIKKRRRSSIMVNARRASKSMTANVGGSAKEDVPPPGTPSDQGISQPKRMSTI